MLPCSSLRALGELVELNAESCAAVRARCSDGVACSSLLEAVGEVADAVDDTAEPDGGREEQVPQANINTAGVIIAVSTASAGVSERISGEVRGEEIGRHVAVSVHASRAMPPTWTTGLCSNADKLDGRSTDPKTRPQARHAAAAPAFTRRIS